MNKTLEKNISQPTNMIEDCKSLLFLFANYLSNDTRRFTVIKCSVKKFRFISGLNEKSDFIERRGEAVTINILPYSQA